MAAVTDSGFGGADARPREVGLVRLYLLRGVYLLIAVGLGTDIWPLVFHHRPWSDVMHGVAVALLAALTALCLLGLRYPLKMLPLLFFELVWKCVWLGMIAAPIWLAHGTMDAATAETAKACLMVVIVPIVMPWAYVWRIFATAPGDRWR